MDRGTISEIDPQMEEHPSFALVLRAMEYVLVGASKSHSHAAQASVQPGRNRCIASLEISSSGTSVSSLCVLSDFAAALFCPETN